MKRKSGVLMPVSCLYGDYSEGSFGKAAEDFIDFLAESGFSYWQVLPFCMTDEHNSPYKSLSAFSGNPFFIDIESLAEEGLVTAEELDGAKQYVAYTCEFKRLWEDRLELLFKAASRFEDRPALDSFLLEHPYSREFAVFMAKREANGEKPWWQWTLDGYSEASFYAWAFIEYSFHRQWKRVRSYANRKGISIIGDVPIYVDYNSADVYFHREMFDLDEKGSPRGVAGVPPDAFSADGQLWGNPLYSWKEMKKDGFSWWRDRMRHMLSLFDGVRIDHFRGFDTYFDIPATALTAKEGVWRRGPGRPFVDMLKEECGDALIIAEDLGERMASVEKLLSYSKFPGMRILQFAFDGEAESRHLPHNYSENAVAYTGTHDNNTLLAYVFEADAGKRRELFRYCGYEGESFEEGCLAAVRTMLASHAALVVLPIQDLLLFGSDTRFNTPGVEKGNWGFRITREQLASIDRARLLDWNTLYRRI